MVILLALIYIAGIVLFAAFLVTRRFLRRRQGTAVTSTERYLHSLNLMSLCWVVGSTFGLSLNEFLVIMTPVHTWPLSIEFLNEAFSLSPIYLAFMFSLPTVAALVVGYHGDPREIYYPVNALGHRWLWALTVLFAILGVVGIATGILV